ncbi:MAG: glycosyltransferase family 9 protein [Kiritimatiellia bacterium]|nr:glycosyltransferase family 9 protein [Kiritimatiellia bacterium]
MKAFPRILVLRGGAIGDFILTLPALHRLREAWPEAHIEVAGYPHIAELARLGGLADQVVSLYETRMARLYVLNGPLDPELGRYLAGFDRLIAFLHDPDGNVARNLEESAVRDLALLSPVDPPEHAADHLLKPVAEMAGRPSGPAVPRLALSEAAKVRGCDWMIRQGATDRPALLHAGSGSSKKNWPVARFILLARKLRAAGRSVVFSLGEADEDLAPEIRACCRDSGWPLLENASLPEVASVLSAAESYVGNDSGITHLAAALGLQTVAIFGPSDAAIWGPRGDRVQILQAADRRLESVSVEEVEDALKPG